MDSILINSENSKTSNPHRQLLNLLDKLNLRKKRQICGFIKSYIDKYKKVIQKP